MQLKPVNEIVAGIRKSLSVSLKIYSPAEVKGRLKNVAEREEAKVVVALGKESLQEALQLPASIPVIYDLVVTPPVVNRANTTGFYMATPVKAYAELIRSQIHHLGKVAVIGSREMITLLSRDAGPSFFPFIVSTPFELADAVKRVEDVNAILLLPDASLLTATALEEAYLASFRKGIPLLGVSEKNVKQGALLALVVDTIAVGRAIGEHAAKALHGTDIGQIPPSPPRRFDLFLNTDTARRMGIKLPDEVIRTAKRVFP
jgi:ABC-type uncharacterized transport system substrate-binding protein